jgi:hypothetical protein
MPTITTRKTTTNFGLPSFAGVASTTVLLEGCSTRDPDPVVRGTAPLAPDTAAVS